MNIERTGKRSLEYSEFRRTIENGCYCIDLDWIEWRKNRGIVAFIETKKIGEATKFQYKVYLELGEKCNVPVYTVTYYDLNKFFVKNMKTLKSKIMTKNEYKKFIQNL